MQGPGYQHAQQPGMPPQPPFPQQFPSSQAGALPPQYSQPGNPLGASPQPFNNPQAAAQGNMPHQLFSSANNLPQQQQPPVSQYQQQPLGPPQHHNSQQQPSNQQPQGFQPIQNGQFSPPNKNPMTNGGIPSAGLYGAPQQPGANQPQVSSHSQPQPQPPGMPHQPPQSTASSQPQFPLMAPQKAVSPSHQQPQSNNLSSQNDMYQNQSPSMPQNTGAPGFAPPGMPNAFPQPSMQQGYPPQSYGQQPGQNHQQLPGQHPPQLPGQQPPQLPGQPPQLPGQYSQQQIGQPPQQFDQYSQQPGQQQPQFPGQYAQQPGQYPPQMGQNPQYQGGAPGGYPPAGNPPGMPGAYPGGYAPQPGMPGAAPPWDAPRQQRLDPNSLPSAVQVIEDDRQTRSGAFPTGYPTAEYPPLVTTEFYANDHGNSNPKFMRSSFYSVPATQDFIKQSQIPFALSITPFAKLSSSEYNPPVIDLGELGPVRCHRCKAYISPFMEFIDGGRKFKCPFCHTATQVEETYFAHLDHTGRRTDIQHRQELYLGSYEFVATKFYCKNSIPPKQPAFIFFLDVSYNAMRSGLIDLFCQQLPTLLKKLPRDYNQDKSSMRIGFATYDQTLHFYNLSNSQCPEMLIANDVSDVFVPFVEGFLVDFNQAEEALKCCLEQVRTCFADTRITETMLGPVIQAGMDALRGADCSGKIFVFHTSIPTFEAPGRLKNREDRKILGTDKEKTQLLPATEFYTKLGEECIKIGCAVDIFLFPNSYLDVASFAPVCNISGGSIYKYQYFDGERDGPRFLADLQHDISREVAFDVMMRVRTSTGLRPTGFFGDFFMQNTTDIEIGALDADKGMIVECKYDDKLDEKVPAVFQAAILFTSCGGQRRLRIHNISLLVTTDYNAIYRFADQDTIVTYLFKNAAKLIRDKSPKEMRDELFHRCAQILATYREKCSQQSPNTQLVLPECLKLLPLYLGCILRTDALSGGSELTVDDRVWLLQLVSSLRIDISMRLLYPQVLPITNLEMSENSSQLAMPTPIRASYEYMDSNEIYLIENGIIGFIWVGLGAPVDFINDVFNAQSLQHLDTESHILPERDNARSRAVRKLLADINTDRPMNLKLFIIKQNDSLESWMKKFLVEDKYAASSVSYVDFLCQLHREIRTLLS